ncbi:MAG: phosphatidate cytidylyltransferase [Candidatus Bipolaricaulota bacterium]
MKTVTKRIITSLITAPAVLALLYFAKQEGVPWAVGLFLAIMAAIGTAEFCNLMRESNIKARIIPTSILAGLAFFAYALLGPLYGYLIGTTTLLVSIITNLGFRSTNENAKAVFAAILGLVYVPGLLHYFYLIYLSEYGIIHAINLLLIVWGYDTGAYLFGKTFGSSKIAPEVSPNKTLEGVAGGLIVAFIGASISAFISPEWEPYIRWLPHIGILAVLVGFSTQLGDLTESWLKRVAGVKDSGHLFPGHGGVLDRIDGLLFALPVFYFYFHYMVEFVW